MGTVHKKFTLISKSWTPRTNKSLVHNVAILLLLLCLSVVTGTTQDLISNQHQHNKIQDSENAFTPQKLPFVLPNTPKNLPQNAPPPPPLLSTTELDNQPQRQEHNHILRRKRQAGVRVQPDYERFYLCLFTLFTNPNCRPQQQVDNTQYISPGQSVAQGQRNDDAGNTFVSVIPQNHQNPRPGLFGLGLGGNGIFGGRFGLNPHTFNSYNPNVNYNPFGFQNTNANNPTHSFYPPQQTPYPEQQVHRRPGPPPTTTTIATTTPSTTTTRPTTTTQRTTVPTTTTTRPYFTSRTSPTSTWTTSTPFHIFQPGFGFGQNSRFPVRGDCNKTGDSEHSESRFPDRTIAPSSSTTTTPRPSPTTTTPTWSQPIVITTPCPELATLKTVTKENVALKVELDSTTKEVLDYQVQNKYLQEALSTLQSENAKLKPRVASLERTNEHLQQQNGQLQHSTGDQKTQINEWKSKVKYLEDKLVRLSRQGIEEQKQITRLQKRVRELGQENVECKSQIYQLQLRHTQRIVQESATSMEMEMQGHQDIKSGRFPHPQQARDDVSTSTEQFTAFKIPSQQSTSVEYDVESRTEEGEVTTPSYASLEEVGTTVPGEVATEIVPLMDDDKDESENEKLTTLIPDVTSTPKPHHYTTTVAPKTSTVASTPVTIKSTTTSTPSPVKSEAFSSETYETIFPSLNSQGFASHPGIIFDDDEFSQFGEITGATGGEDDSNEFSILFADPNRAFTFGGDADLDPNLDLGTGGSILGPGGQFYTPANINAFNTHSGNSNSNSNGNNNGMPLLSPYQYWKFPFHHSVPVSESAKGQGQGQNGHTFYTSVYT